VRVRELGAESGVQGDDREAEGFARFGAHHRAAQRGLLQDGDQQQNHLNQHREVWMWPIWPSTTSPVKNKTSAHAQSDVTRRSNSHAATERVSFCLRP